MLHQDTLHVQAFPLLPDPPIRKARKFIQESIPPFVAERRTAPRYSIALPVEFADANGLLGNGCTLDISRTGVRFATDKLLPVGVRVVVGIDWPSSVEGNEVSLRMYGVIVRSEANEVAARITRSVFQRTGLV